MDNKALQRFELSVGEGVVFARYRRDGAVCIIDHVETPPALRGQGLAGRLMEAIMAAARAEGFKVRPVCGYAVAHLRRHPEHRDLIA